MFTRDLAIGTFRSHGMRLTPQRLAVVDALAAMCGTHPSAEQVAARVASRVEGVSLSTIYKVLNEVADLDLVTRIPIEGSMRFDDNVAGHAHLLCEECGAVVDLEIPTGMGEELSALAASQGARVARAQVNLTGRCAACLARAN